MGPVAGGFDAGSVGLEAAVVPALHRPLGRVDGGALRRAEGSDGGLGSPRRRLVAGCYQRGAFAGATRGDGSVRGLKPLPPNVHDRVSNVSTQPR